MTAPVPVDASDLLVHGDDAPGRRWGRWWVAVAALAVVAALVAWGDSAQRHREFEQLVARSAAGATAAVDADGVVESTVQYASPLLVSTRVPAEVRADLGRLVSRSAERAAVRLQADREELAATPVLPWHTALREARDAAVAYLDTRLAYLAAVAADERARASRPDFTRGFDSAVAALAAAAPDPAAAAGVAARLGGRP